MILDQLEVVAEGRKQSFPERLFYIQSKDVTEVVDLKGAEEFVVGFWRKFRLDGKDRKFKVIPIVI
jgi:hypothetical protein